MTTGGTIERFTLDAPAVPVRMILRLQRYRDTSKAPRKVREAAEKAVMEAHELADPRVFLWRGTLSGVDADGTITLSGGHQFHSPTFARLLADSSELCALLLTLGDGIEDSSRKSLDNDRLLEGLMMDTCGWATISLSLRAARRKIAELENFQGCRLTSALAPGYLDWPLAELETLFDLFAGESLPVALNEFQTMLPRKSISSVFGVVPALSQ